MNPVPFWAPGFDSQCGLVYLSLPFYREVISDCGGSSDRPLENEKEGERKGQPKVGNGDSDESFEEDEGLDYLLILDPKRSKFSFKRACTKVLNNCQLPAFMPNMKAGARKGKSDTSFNRNVVVFFGGI